MRARPDTKFVCADWIGRTCQLVGAASPCAVALQALRSGIAASLKAWLPLPSGSEACNKVLSTKICTHRPPLSVAWSAKFFAQGLQALCNRIAASLQAWLSLPSGSEARHIVSSIQICTEGLPLSVSRGGQALCSRSAGPVWKNCCLSAGVGPLPSGSQACHKVLSGLYGRAALVS